MTSDHNPQVLSLRWRAGSKNHRTVYAQLGDAPSLEDVCLGMMDSEELAQEVVDAHNVDRHRGNIARDLASIGHISGRSTHNEVERLQRLLDEESETWGEEVRRLRHNLDQEHDLVLEYTGMHTELKAAVDRAGFETVAGTFVLRDGTKTRYQLRVRAASTVLRQIGAWLDSQVMGGTEAVVNVRREDLVGGVECTCGVNTVGNQNHLPNCPMYDASGARPRVATDHTSGTGPDC